MEPTAEQLIRDYLNRLSVAARTRLRSDDRRAFLARTRELIERRSGSPATADPGQVQDVLSSLGEPVAAVENEYARLAAVRSKRAAARSGAWRPRGSPAREPPPDADAGPGSDAAADPRPASGSGQTRSPRDLPRAAVDVSHLASRELKGDIEKKVKVNRPLTSRWRPGQPARPEPPSRPVRIGRAGGSRRDVNGAGPSGSGAGSQRADSNDLGSPATVPEPAAPQAPSAETPPRGTPSAASVLPVDRLPAAGHVPAAAPETRAPETATPETPSPGASGPGAAPLETGTPEASSPGGSVPVPASLEAGQRADGSAARPAGGVPAPAARSTRVVTSPLPRLQRRRPPGVTPGRARRLMGFWGGRRLEATSVILMVLGGLVYPFPVWVLGFALWLLGVILAAASQQWSPWDKWAGILGPVVLVIAGTSVGLALGGQRQSLAAYGHEVLADSRYMIQIAAPLGAAYLAWRAYRGRRDPVPPWNRPHRI
jgi:hypothetical protein